MLTSAKSKSDVEKGLQVADFTKTPEWCDPKIFEASLDLLKTLNEEYTPHRKAMVIEQAVKMAIMALQMALPYRRSDAIGEPERQRVMRYLILELCKYF